MFVLLVEPDLPKLCFKHKLVYKNADNIQMDKTPSLFARLYRSIAARIRLWLDRRAFYNDLVNRSSKGYLTGEDRTHIQSQFERLRLSMSNLGSVKRRAYRAAFKSIESAPVVTKEMEIQMDQIQGYLQISFDEIERERTQLDRLRLLAEIEQGNLPRLRTHSLILQKNEIPHWSEPGDLLEVKVVGRRYEGGSSGVSVRVAKGVSFRVGNHRGRVVSEKELVAVSSGNFIITNKRLVFSGAAKSFEIKLEKILNINVVDDGLMFNTGSREKPYAVRFDSRRDVEIIEAIIKQVMSKVAA